MKPDFFILGAPKCGTTSLATWLSQTSSVFVSPIKEPHYFNFDDKHRNITSANEYENLFRNATRHYKALGEASVWYLSSHVAVPKILEYQPNARFIVMLRNPVELAQSLHQQNKYGLYEDIENFESAWRAQEGRARGELAIRDIADPRHLQYSEACKLGEQLHRLYSMVEKDRVLVILLEDLRVDPRSVYLSALNFLGVDGDPVIDLRATNVAKTYRSRVMKEIIRVGSRMKRKLGIYRSFGFDRLNTKPQKRQTISAAFKEELVEHFRQDVNKLESLIQRDLSGWSS